MPRLRLPQLPTLDLLDVAWQEDAACRDTDEGLWHISDRADAYPGERRRRERHALTICASCPVKDQCLDWALQLDDRHAILGGTTPDDRRKIRRRRQSRALRAQRTT